MKITIHQPEFMPYGGFFAKAMRADALILADLVQAKKNYFENRNRFVVNEQAAFLTVPMQQSGRLNGTFLELRIAENKRWRRKLLLSLAQNYRQHPFFSEVYPTVEMLVLKERNRLVELNVDLIQFFLHYLHVNIPIIRMSSMSLITRKGSAVLAEMARSHNATTYISGPSGRNYLQLEYFHGIEVVYHEFHTLPYPQPKLSKFISHLSIFDILCCCGSEQARKLLFAGSELKSH